MSANANVPLDWNLAIYDRIESIISDHPCDNCLTHRSSSFTTSSGFGESSNFRQEIRQSYYRNDPVKYGHTTLNISRMDSVGGFFSLSFSWKSHRKRIGTERKFLDMKLNSLTSILTLFKRRRLYTLNLLFLMSANADLPLTEIRRKIYPSKDLSVERFIRLLSISKSDRRPHPHLLKLSVLI